MDIFFIIFLIVAGLGIFGFYKLAKGFYKRLVKGYNPPKPEDYSANDNTNQLGSHFNSLVAQLEIEREKYYKKTQGMFKRAFLRTFMSIAIIFLLLGKLIGMGGDPVARIVGPLMISAVLALIGGGMYTLIRKGINSVKFSQMLKQELVSKIVEHVNPQLTFCEEGIEKEEFEKADLFKSNKYTTLVSEDTISGEIDGKPVSICECELRSGSGEEIQVFFKGLFIQAGIEGFNLQTPLKFIPGSKTPDAYKGYAYNYLRVNSNDKVNIPGAHKYEVYSEDNAESQRFVSDKVIKLADHIFDKYDKEGGKVLENMPLLNNMPFFKDVAYSNSVFISIVNNTFYLALQWPEAMFETDAFLKNNLVESGIAQKIYQDILFIDQLLKEISGINE